MTLIGGEPFLYDRHNRGQGLLELVDRAKDAGYKYIRIDTNGQQCQHLLGERSLTHVSNLAVSLDGHDSTTNDQVRGRGSFGRAISFIHEALEWGHYVSVTTCVHRANVDCLDEMISFATALGVRELNFHPLFKMGIARDEFSGETNIAPERWIQEYDRLTAAIARCEYSIPVRVPRRFVTNEEYSIAPWKYEYCPTQMGERILVHPDGDMRICALCIGTSIRIAKYSLNRVEFCGDESEISPDRTNRRPCMSQTKEFGGLTPLCISYKPRQNEFVWVQGQVDDQLFGNRDALET
jgi:MoaA/NifB/PqqE/SkfB family radical SAM enzyme